MQKCLRAAQLRSWPEDVRQLPQGECPYFFQWDSAQRGYKRVLRNKYTSWGDRMTSDTHQHRAANYSQYIWDVALLQQVDQWHQTLQTGPPAALPPGPQAAPPPGLPVAAAAVTLALPAPAAPWPGSVSPVLPVSPSSWELHPGHPPGQGSQHAQLQQQASAHVQQHIATMNTNCSCAARVGELEAEVLQLRSEVARLGTVVQEMQRVLQRNSFQVTETVDGLL